MANLLVGMIMGSKSDWETMKIASDVLNALQIGHECKVISAHRAPDCLFEYASGAAGRGIKVIIAGAGGAAHLPGVTAAKTMLPVIGIPIQTSILGGLDSLLSILQMPAGIPVATTAIGADGARNAAIHAATILGTQCPEIRARLKAWRSTWAA